MSETLTAKKTLAIFDLDNTLIRGESQKFFLLYLYQRRLISFGLFCVILAWFAAYKLRFVKNPRHPLELALKNFVGFPEERVTSIAEAFVAEILPSKFDPKLLAVLEREKRESAVVLVSNAIRPVVLAVSKKLGISSIIFTELESSEGKLTGHIAGKIVYGEEKLVRVREVAKKLNFELSQTRAYADHHSDLALLSAVGYPIAVNPDKILRNEAERRNWQIIFSEN